MYASEDAGVRIRLRIAPFALHDNTGQLEARGVEICEEITPTVVSQGEMLERGYFITPMLYNDPKAMVRKIEYVDDESRLVPCVLDRTEKELSIELDKIGTCKNTHWSFQREWRYLLHAFDVGANLDSNGRTAVFQALQDGLASNSTTAPFDYYDMSIDPVAFSEMEIMLSPRISAGNRIIVDTLAKEFNPTATLLDSVLHGLV